MTENSDIWKMPEIFLEIHEGSNGYKYFYLSVFCLEQINDNCVYLHIIWGRTNVY